MENQEQRRVCCNLQCLRTKLTCCCGKLERAVEMGSASTVRSILDCKNFTTEELDKALISALIWKFPECLDALLKSGARRRKAFNSISPYHVLLTFCMHRFSQYTSPMSNILETLRVLTTYPDLDINCKEPKGCYPLYTLIHMMFEDEDWCAPNRQSTNMACLEMLLEAGANPNFDERRDDHPYYVYRCAESFDYEYLVGGETYNVYRNDRYSSGLNGVFISFGNMLRISDNSSYQVQHSVELLGQSCRFLLQHGCNANHINVHGTTPLHDLMKLWTVLWPVQPYATGHRQLPLCQIQSILLSYGADPNKPTPNTYINKVPLMPRPSDGWDFEVPMDSYPVHYYNSSLMSRLEDALPHVEFWPTLPAHLRHVLPILLFMDLTCAAEAGTRIIECWHGRLGRPQPLGVPVEVFEEIQDSVWRVLHEGRTLLSLSQLAVWKAIGRNFHAAETRRWLKMNIPQNILHDLETMFVCQCHN